MPGISLDSLNDLHNLTEPWRQRNKWTQLVTELQRHPFARQILSDKRMSVEGGAKIERTYQVDSGTTARHSGAFAVDVVNYEQKSIKGEVELRHNYVPYTIDELIIVTNRGNPMRIVQELAMSEYGAQVELVKLIENHGWSTPVNDGFRFHPLQYWVVKNTDGTLGGGFNGLNPINFPAGAAGIDSTVHPEHANWTDTYTAVTVEDLVKKIRKAMDFTNFMSPFPYPSYDLAPDVEMYVPYSVWEAFQTLGSKQNENIGPDVAFYDGKTHIRNVRMTWVPALDSDVDAPIYMINWGKMRVAYNPSMMWRRMGPERVSGQHTVFRWFIDNLFTLDSWERRGQAVITKAA